MDSSCQIRGRFAPSPSGRMHLGNAWTALLAWLSARSKGGAMILRMEDLDPDRCKPHFARHILEDLSWLGLSWDEGPDVGGPHGPYVQNERRDMYQRCLDELAARRMVYPCTCTRAELRAAHAPTADDVDLPPGDGPAHASGRSEPGGEPDGAPHSGITQAPHAGEAEPVYPGTCLRLTAEERRARQERGRGAALRLLVPCVRVSFIDLVLGPQSQELAEECGDFVLRRADGVHAYQLAVVADDADQRITEVVRGADLMTSTARQVHLFRTFGWRAPCYAHVPLLVDPDGRRLSKRRGDVDLGQLRDAGASPQAIVGYLAWKAGLLAAPRRAAPHELVDGFSFAPLPAGPLVVEHNWMEEVG